jgi:ABC transporter DrrB family efflux protein
MGAATGIAEDLQGGLFDRLRSLPIRLLSIIAGRLTADTTLLVWSLAVTTFIGVLVGFRVQNGAAAAVAAFGLCVLYGFAFCWLFVALGLVAGSPQAAQGISFLVFPLSFVSSAYVPVNTMPGWMQAFAAHQPLTYMSNAVRLLAEGHPAQLMVGHSVAAYLPASLYWTAGLIIVFAPLTVWKLRRS